MAEKNDSLEALNQERKPNNNSITPPSNRDAGLTNASDFIPKPTESKDNSLSRAERIALEESKIKESFQQSKSTSHKGVNIEFSDKDKKNINTEKDQPQQKPESLNDLTKRLAAAQIASNALSPNKKQENEDHDTKIQANKEYKSQSYENPSKLQNNQVKSIQYGGNEEDLDKNFTEKYVKDQNDNYRWNFNQDIVAFQNKGDHIVVYGKPESVSKDVVKVLKSEGVKKIEVEGAIEHKKQIWMAATDKGIEVQGYTPSKEDLKELHEKTNKITILESGKKNDVKESHINAAAQAADKHLNPQNKAQFVKAAENIVNQKQNNNEHIPKVQTKEAEKEIEK